MPSISSINTSIENQEKLVIDPHAKHGQFERDQRGRLIKYSGGFSVVYPYTTSNGGKWAFRCWHANIGDMRKHFQTISDVFSSLKLPYFCDFTYTDEGITIEDKRYPTTRMRWINGKNLKEYICTNRDKKEKLEKLANNFIQMTNMLHLHHISHGDLQHGNILIDTNDNIHLIDYDSIYVEELDGELDTIKGLKGYQHPKRGTNRFANEKTDYFSELIIYLSIIAIAERPQLIKSYNIENTEQLLFTYEDFSNIESSLIYKDLMLLGGVFPLLLNVLILYLKEDDISNLRPFQQYMKKPKILEFKTSTDTFVAGQPYTLTWRVENSPILYLNGNAISTKSAQHTICLTKKGETKLELKAGNGIQTAIKTIFVKVTEPVSIDFHASKNKLKQGKAEKVSLYWEIDNAQNAVLVLGSQSDTIPLKGKKTVSPENSAIYMVHAMALDGITRISKSVSIDVFPESEIDFHTDKKFTYKDVPVTLSWCVKNAVYVHLNGIKVPPVGCKKVTIYKETLYKLEVKDHFGTKQADIVVKILPLPLIKTILLPMPKIEKIITIKQHITSPFVQTCINFKPLIIKFRELNTSIKAVGIRTKSIHPKFTTLHPMHTLSIRIGNNFISRLSTAIDIITNNVKHLKFTSDEQ